MTRSIVGGTVATVLALALPSVSAQPALVLDPAFHPEITAPGGAIERVVRQPDGRLIVFGRFVALNGGGGERQRFVLSLGALPEGKLLAGFGSWSAEFRHYDAAILQLLPDGRENPAFPPVTFTLQANPPSPWGTIHLDLTIQPCTDGGLVMTGGFAGVNGHRRFGLARFRPVPELRAGRGTPAGGLAATIGGRPDWTYRIESSTDLIEWRLIRELPSAGASTPFQDTEAALGPRRFYRIAGMSP